MIVRPERSEDSAAIRNILVAAFPSAAEADLVDRLRRDRDLALAFVADNGGRIHGYAAFLKLTVDDGSVSIARASRPLPLRRTGSGLASVAR